MAVLSKLTARPLTRFFTTPIVKPRTYGAAAAQLDYDDDYDCDHDLTPGMVDGEGSEPRRGVRWVIIGEPGAKKHVYAQGLSKLLNVPHISMGCLIRQQFNTHSSLYKQIENAVNQGKLVSENIIFSLLSRKLEEGYFRGETGFILDGIPKTRMQAEILDQIADIDLVLNFKSSNDNLVKKDLENGLNVHSLGCQFKSFSETAAWKEKLRTYAEQSKPLEDYYRKQKKLLDFQVAGAPRETWRGLLCALDLQHMTSFQKLTA